MTHISRIFGGSLPASNLTFTSTAAAGTSDYISFCTGSQTERLHIATDGTITASGGVAISVSATTTGFSSTVSSGAGSTGGTQHYYNYFNISSDNYDCGDLTTTSYAIGLLVNHAFGGSSAKGGREGLFVGLTQTAATSTSNKVRFYVASSGQGQANHSDGGTILNTTVTGAANNGSGLIRLAVTDSTGFSTSDQAYVMGVKGTTEANGVWVITVIDGTHIDLQSSTFTHAYTSGGLIGLEKGRMYGSNFLGVLSGSGGNFATGFEECSASYDQIFVASSTSVKTKIISQFIYGSSDAVQGTTYDAAIGISAELGAAAGGKYGILIGNFAGEQPLATSATILGLTGSPTIATGIDLSGGTVTTPFKSTGFSVGSAGALSVVSGTAIPAGGTQDVGVNLSSTAHFGVYFGSGAPSLSAAQGSLYLRSDGSSTSTRLYVNTNGTTGWTNVTTAT